MEARYPTSEQLGVRPTLDYYSNLKDCRHVIDILKKLWRN